MVHIVPSNMLTKLLPPDFKNDINSSSNATLWTLCMLLSRDNQLTCTLKDLCPSHEDSPPLKTPFIRFSGPRNRQDYVSWSVGSRYRRMRPSCICPCKTTRVQVMKDRNVMRGGGGELRPQNGERWKSTKDGTCVCHPRTRIMSA